MGQEKGPRVIKRYANRKLYDMSESCYITHDEIAALVEEGEEVRIIDNRTKEDLTSATLTQILFDKERKARKLPIDTLRNLFQSSTDFVQKHITQPVTNLKDEAEKKVSKVFRVRGGEKELEPEPEPEPILDPEPRAKATDALREWVNSTQSAYESLQRNVEDRWSVVTKYLGQFDVNHRRIVELERRVKTLEAQLAHLTGTPIPQVAEPPIADVEPEV
ncbi:MAG: transcriptional regulator [Deltaproteobacteria bacterium]|nr:MAG: transcriptional regulator [Deltaproteobacteria bacterium]